MANHVLLNNVEHKNLKVKNNYTNTFGHDQMCVPVFPVEARHAQAHYPLVFAKDGNGQYQMVALLGLEQGENVFINEGKWNASYKPLVVEKGPFLIGRSSRQEGAEETLSIHVDLDDERVVMNENAVEGAIEVFLPHGGNSEYIDNIANILSTLHESNEAHNNFVETLVELNLIESFVVDVDIDGTGTHRLSGFYTINEDLLKTLDGDALATLHGNNYLETIYMMLASMSQLRHIVALKKASM
jgi:hypothetical protein